MKVKKIEVGSLETNCYVIRSDGEATIVDPGGEAEKIIGYLRNGEGNDPEVKFVLATHFHWDHVDAVSELVDQLDVDFYLGKKDLELFEKSGELDVTPDRLLVEGEKIEVGKNSFEIWETPGHTPGSITLVEEDERKLFVGDLVFSAGFGRTDLPGGSKSDLEKSLKKIVNLDGDWEVYPGHGPVFHLKEKLTSSPFLSDLKEG
ncbi:MAG: MBL fold metallo-hydrolase [Candidatus Bipolaricaulota bacterium]